MKADRKFAQLLLRLHLNQGLLLLSEGFHNPFYEKGGPDTLEEQRRGMIISDVLLEFSLFTFLAVLKADYHDFFVRTHNCASLIGIIRVITAIHLT
jgi:hypothetical protein